MLSLQWVTVGQKICPTGGLGGFLAGPARICFLRAFSIRVYGMYILIKYLSRLFPSPPLSRAFPAFFISCCVPPPPFISDWAGAPKVFPGGEGGA